MYRELYQYLVLHGKLDLPGIGIFSAERKPAEIDFASKQVVAPSYVIALLRDHNSVPSKKLFSWLSSTLNISELDAVIRFNDFVFDLRQKLLAGNKLQWNHLGTLSKGLSGEIIFEAAQKEPIESAVRAMKVLRGKTDHTVTVGEYERTSGEMRELLGQGKEKRSYWWAVALIIGIISAIFIGYYFSAKGLNSSSAGNQQRIFPQEQTTTH